MKLIQVPKVGIENLNTEILSKYDILVCNSHLNALSVDESAVALLSSMKKIPYYDKPPGNRNRNNSITEDSKESLSTYGSYIKFNSTFYWI